ncbi:MAG: hypothetical protein ACI82A_001141 [Candidatus Azotimanducaceae bacterium]|jgi:hypothetical protein
MKTTLGKAIASTFMVFAMLGVSQGAFATLAADHVIRNTVLVDYEDSAGNTQGQISATVDITVDLIAAAVTVTPSPTSIGPLNVSTTTTVSYVVDSNANGDDGYTFAPVLGNAGGAAGSAGTLSLATGSGGVLAGSVLSLGGTSATGTAVTFTTGITTATITVPMDSTAGDALSGFEAGDTIILNATTGTGTNAGGGQVVCTVSTSGITDGVLFNATATIAVEACTHAGVTGNVISLVDGDQIGERATLELIVNTGVSAGTITLDSTLTSTGLDAGDAATVGTAATVTITVLAVDLQIYKFVRNVDTAANNPTCPNTAGGGVADFTCLAIAGGATYFSTISAANLVVKADPGDTLEYAILMYNNASLVQNVTLDDSIVAFTTYLPADNATLLPKALGSDEVATADGPCDTSGGTDGSGTCTISTDGAGTSVSFSSGTDTAGDDWLEFSSTTVQANAGHVANAAPDNTTGGQIDAFNSGTPNVRSVSVVIFTVDVDNN